MYPRIAVVTLMDGSKIVFGTYEEHMSNDEAAQTIKDKRWGLESPPVEPSDIWMTIIIPDDGFPYNV